MDWRKRRNLAYLYKEFDDVNLEHDYIFMQGIELADLVVDFFFGGSQLIFPAKSYFVAIIYAKCLERYFGIDFYEALDTEDLLVDDKYFLPYSQNSMVYDIILEKVGDIWGYKSIEPTVRYFREEFLIDEE